MGMESHGCDMACVSIPVAVSLVQGYPRLALCLPQPSSPCALDAAPCQRATPPPADRRGVNFQQTQADTSAKDFLSSYQQEFGEGCV